MLIATSICYCLDVCLDVLLLFEYDCYLKKTGRGPATGAARVPEVLPASLDLGCGF